MNFKEYIILEKTLSFGDLSKYAIASNDFTRFQKFVSRLANKEPFLLSDGGEEVIDVDQKWLRNIKSQIQRLELPEPFSAIPLASGELYPLRKIAKSAELGGRAEGKGQPGGAFEELFYNQIKDLTENGPITLKIKGDSYTVTGIEPPAGASTVKADLVLHTDGSDLYISLKQTVFPSYAGIGNKGSNYQIKLSSHPLIKKYIKKLKAFLNGRGLCKNEDGVLKCKQGNNDYHYIPSNSELDMEDFGNFVIFGDREFEDELNYVDYIISGETSNQPFEEEDGEFVLSPSLKVFKNGDPIDPALKPAFLTRKAIGRSSYGISDVRTMIVPTKETRGLNIITGEKRVKKSGKKLKAALNKARMLVPRGNI